MTEYKAKQIIKHALAYYIQRPTATPAERTAEKALLEKITEETERLKQRYRISEKEAPGEHETTT